MKPSQSFVSLFLLGTLAAAGACAEGSTSTATDLVEPKQSKEPTEPADESVTLPPGDDGDSTDLEDLLVNLHAGDSSWAQPPR